MTELAAVFPSKNCDLCGKSRFELIATRDRWGKPLETDVCTTCGLVSHRRIPSDDQLKQFYATRYRQQYQGETIPSSRRVMRAWGNGQRIFRQLRPWVGEGAAIFEVGAGIGCTVKAFERSGIDATGIEPHNGFQSYAAGKLRAHVENASLYDVASRPAYDMILLVHVIEHFNSARRALRHIRSLLRGDGMLYVECPNLSAPFACRRNLFHPAHVFNFTPSTLEMLASRCGFQLEVAFSGPDDPNLQMLFRRAKPRCLVRDNSYQETMAALRRSHFLAYHLRWNYVWRRSRKLASYLLEHVLAARKAEQISQSCCTAANLQLTPLTREATHPRVA